MSRGPRRLPGGKVGAKGRAIPQGGPPPSPPGRLHRLLKKGGGTATRPTTVWERGLPARPRPNNAAYVPKYWCEAQVWWLAAGGPAARAPRESDFFSSLFSLCGGGPEPPPGSDPPGGPVE